MMSVQLFISEVFVTVALFVLGVVGYLLSRNGKNLLFGHRFTQLSETKVVENKVDSEETPASESVMKKTTSKSKNAESRRRAKRQAKENSVANNLVDVLNARANDELDEMTEYYYQHEANNFGAITKKPIVPELPSAYANNEEQAAVDDESDAEATAAPNENVEEASMSLSPEEEQEEEQKSRFMVSPMYQEDKEEEVSTSPETNGEATSSEQLQHDADECGREAARPDESCSEVALEGEEGAEQCYPDAVPSEFDGDDDGLVDFNIPPTPPYGDDDLLMPAYTTDSVRQFQDTPTSAQSFTDGNQLYEGFLSQDGQQLYTDGEQVFMLACVEMPAEPSTPCAGTHDGVEPCGMLASCYGDFPDAAIHAGQAYGFASHSYANDGVEVDDLWNVCWEDFMPEAFAPPAEF